MTIYDRFNRWSRRRFWLQRLAALVDPGKLITSTAIDSTYVKIQRTAFGEKRALVISARRCRCGRATNFLALTDVVRRPYALILTPGNISDFKVTPALLERGGRLRYLPGDTAVLSLPKGATKPTACTVRSVRQAPFPSYPDVATPSEPSATTSNHIAPVIPSKKPSGACITSAASPPATKNNSQFPVGDRA